MTELKGILNRTFQKRQALNSRYSQNAFARDLGISPTALSQFLSGKRKFSKTNLQRIVRSLGLPPEHGEQFFQESIPFPLATRIKMDTFSLIAEWFHFAILNLVEIDTIKSPSQISKRLGISLDVTNTAIERLLHLGFLTNAKGVFQRMQIALDVGSSDVPSEALRKHNREKMELAIESLERVALNERDMSSLTVCFDLENMSQVRNEIMRFKKRVAAICGTDEASEVYSLNVQFFPLSKKEISP